MITAPSGMASTFKDFPLRYRDVRRSPSVRSREPRSGLPGRLMRSGRSRIWASDSLVASSASAMTWRSTDPCSAEQVDGCGELLEIGGGPWIDAGDRRGRLALRAPPGRYRRGTSGRLHPAGSPAAGAQAPSQSRRVLRVPTSSPITSLQICGTDRPQGAGDRGTAQPAAGRGSSPSFRASWILMI